MPISSPDNQRLKEVRKLARRAEDGRFIGEGEDLLDAADAAGWRAVERLVAAGSGLPGTEVQPELLARVSTLGSGTRAIGIFEQRWSALTGPVCVALFGVRDPGNVGTVLRSAAAFGASCVAIGAGTADPYGPKAVRASMGAVFQVPVARLDALADLPRPAIALTAEGDDVLRGPLEAGTLMVGAERDGLPAAALEAADRHARIPIRTESLNAAMAATVALYEITRR